MVTVTFPTRPQVALHPEPSERAAPDPRDRRFHEVFDLPQPDGPASAGPPSPDAPQSPDMADDSSNPSQDEPEQRPAGDRSPDRAEGATIAPGQTALPSGPAPGPSGSGVILTDGGEEPQLPDFMTPGVPVLQALMILTATSADARANPVVQPVGETTAPAAAILLPQGIAPVPAAVVTLPPGLDGAAARPSGEVSQSEPVPTDKAVDELRLFILAEPPAVGARKPDPADGVPAFWAAREAAGPDAEASGGPDPAQGVTLLKDSATTRPAVEPRADNAAAQSLTETVASFAGEEPSVQRDAKPGLAPLQALVGGPSQAAAATTSLMAPAQMTLPSQVPAQIAAALAARPERPLELRIAPVELGGLTVNLRQDGEILRVVVQADRPETLDLLRRNGEILLEELRLAGFSGAALSFGDGGGKQDRRASASSHATPVTEKPLSSAAATSRPVQTAQGLDLRL
jgi:flagellar hook-length control protein FliK